MSTSTTERLGSRAIEVDVTDDALVVELSDGRTVSAPIAWYPRLLHATRRERSRWRLVGDGEGINWPDLDEDISVAGLLKGRSSGESQASLKRWLASQATRRSKK
jgi:hypothetical protein